jgi:hypothetical protein
MSSQPSHYSNNKGFIAVLLKQASGIFGKLLHGEVLEHVRVRSTRGYKVVNSEEFAELIQQSKTLVNYTDCFVLKDPSDKRTEIYLIGESIPDMDPYHALCYVTGILDTIVSTLPKRKIPEMLTSYKQKGAMSTVIYQFPRLNDLIRRMVEDTDDGDIGV